MTPTQERLLEEFLRSQQAADIVGKLERLDEAVQRIGDMYLRLESDRAHDVELLRGDIRGVSLRVGELEKGHAALNARTAHLEKRDDHHEKALETSQSWILGDLEKKKTKAEGFLDNVKDPRTIVAVVSAIAAAVSWAWHLYH